MTVKKRIGLCRRSSPAPRPIRVLAMLAGVAGCAALSLPVRAGDEKLPAAAKILDKYVEVTGGRVAYERLKNRISKGTCDFASMGAKAALTTYEAAPNKRYVILEAAEMGRMEDGTTGDVAWEVQAMAGPRIKEGTEKADALRDATFNAPVYWSKLYKKVECVGLETFADKPCYKIVLTPAQGNPQTHYYDRESNLLVGTAFVLEHPMGTLDVQMRMNDYRRVDGVSLAHEVHMSYAGQEQIVKIETIEHNVAIPEDRFALPEEIRLLTAGSKKREDAGG